MNLKHFSYICTIDLGLFMKKVKITILKTMLNEDLAKEYGICGLKACPMMKVGDVFLQTTQSPLAFVTKLGRPFTSMCLHWLMVQTRSCSTMVTGSKNQV